MFVLSVFREWILAARTGLARLRRLGSGRRVCANGVTGAAVFTLALCAGMVGASSDDPLPEFELGGELRALPVDRLRVIKAERRLELLSGDTIVDEYDIALGSNPVGPKRAQGDGRTPEGRYRIDWRKPDSQYHLALHISYPSAEDRDRARARGVTPGGAIMIHGLPNGMGFIGKAHSIVDWTDGCIAVSNEEMEEIWERVPDGVPIEILP